MLVRLVLKQLNILQGIPKLQVVHDCRHRQPTCNVTHPSQILHGLINSPPRSRSLVHKRNQSRSKLFDGLAVQPTILPEEGRSSISHQGGNRNGEHGCDVGVHLDVECRPGSVLLSHSQRIRSAHPRVSRLWIPSPPCSSGRHARSHAT